MEAPQQKPENFFLEILKFTLIAVIVVVPIRLFVAQPFIVSGASMESTFHNGEYLIVDELTYHLSEPTRGDVIIFKFPLEQTTFFIKRIIGLPGETVEIDRGKITIYNDALPGGFELIEPYLDAENVKNDSLRVELGEDQYFVLGDNRNASSDSRVWGTLDRELIVGRALVRLLPITGIELFPGEVEK